MSFDLAGSLALLELILLLIAVLSGPTSSLSCVLRTQSLSSLACISDFTSVVLFVAPSDLSSSSPRRISEDVHRPTIKKGEAR